MCIIIFWSKKNSYFNKWCSYLKQNKNWSSHRREYFQATATGRGCSNLVTVVNLDFQWVPLVIGELIQDIKTKKYKKCVWPPQSFVENFLKRWKTFLLVMAWKRFKANFLFENSFYYFDIFWKFSMKKCYLDPFLGHFKKGIFPALQKMTLIRQVE